jgi:hypothetical protein
MHTRRSAAPTSHFAINHLRRPSPFSRLGLETSLAPAFSCACLSLKAVRHQPDCVTPLASTGLESSPPVVSKRRTHLADTSIEQPLKRCGGLIGGPTARLDCHRCQGSGSVSTLLGGFTSAKVCVSHPPPLSTSPAPCMPFPQRAGVHGPSLPPFSIARCVGIHIARCVGIHITRCVGIHITRCGYPHRTMCGYPHHTVVSTPRRAHWHTPDFQATE